MFLDDFKTYIGKFKKIIPHDYKEDDGSDCLLSVTGSR